MKLTSGYIIIKIVALLHKRAFGLWQSCPSKPIYIQFPFYSTKWVKWMTTPKENIKQHRLPALSKVL